MKYQLSGNQLKIIAMVAMVLDHFVAIFINHNTEIGMMLRVIGRVVAPIMCYFIAEGYHKTSNTNKYMSRLLIFAMISHFAYNTAFGFTFFQATSAMWGLFLGLAALRIFDNKQINLLLRIGGIGFCCLLAVPANWNYISVLWILGFGIFYGNKKKQMIAFIVISLGAHLIPTFLNFGFNHEGFPHWYQFGVFLAIPLLLAYNGNRGKKLPGGKFGFYILYPAHLIVLHLVNIGTSLKDFLWSVII